MSHHNEDEYWDEAQSQLEGDPAPIEQIVTGEQRISSLGGYFAAIHHWTQEYWHGRLPISWLTENSSISANSLGRWLGEGVCSDWCGAVFLDTETTGLRPGSGTTVFLAGLGWLEDGFHLEQLLMRNSEEEPGFLAAVAARISSASLLVTFNGRSFDVPVLAARYQLAGVQFPELPPHLDLLTLARIQWRRHLPSCSLASLEFHRLGVEREQDVPGHMVPGLYRRYLATDDGRLLAPVLEHNATDVLSMVTLAGHLCQETDE